MSKNNIIYHSHLHILRTCKMHIYTNYISLCSFHWILTIINVEKEIIFLLDPLSHRIRDQDWKYVVNM